MLRDTPPNLEHESELFKQGFDYVVGMDEVGRGCLAGPVVVGATILPKEFKGFVCDVPINDSKKLTNNKRRRVNEAITDQAVTATGHATASEIDTYGITWATHTAALRALEELEGICAESTFVLTDNRLLSKELGFPFAYDSILKGDSSSIAIAAASVIAKVHRDDYMINLSQQPEYTAYNLEQNVGYGTKYHISAIASYGPSDQHRMTFLNNILSKTSV